MTAEILVLSRRNLESLMQFDDYVDAVAEAFRLHAEGRAISPAPLHIPADGGSFHVKAGSLPLAQSYVAVKTNSNFPQNRRDRGLPTIQGAILLLDGVSGRPLALLDSIEITIKRTGAATALATRHLARPQSRRVTICGCGAQGRVQLLALKHCLDIDHVFAWDADSQAAAAYAAEMTTQHGLPVQAVSTLRTATLESDVIVTCTTSHEPFLAPVDVRPGTFIAAIGTDNPEKSEIQPELMARSTVVTDVTAQCVVMGDLHHAIHAGTMREADVHAELGDLVAGRASGRTRPDEITIFDSSGVGFQDVAASARAYELARKHDAGTRLALG